MPNLDHAKRQYREKCQKLVKKRIFAHFKKVRFPSMGAKLGNKNESGFKIM